MIELIEGNYYDVSGKDEVYPHKNVTWPECMYIRIEQIGGKQWYVFAYVHDNEFLHRVRIPRGNTQIEGNKVISPNEVVMWAILMGDTHLDLGSHTLQVTNFLEEAKRLSTQGIPSQKKAKLQELLEKATSF